MPPSIEPSIKTRVIQQWLSGDPRPKIALDNDIGEGTVGSIINYFKIGLDSGEFDSAREISVAAKKQGLNLSDLASNFRLHNFIKTSGAAEDKIESFIDNINSSNLPPEKVVDLVIQLFNISNTETIPPDQVSNYIREELEQKQKIDEAIKEANDILQSKNVDIETINEYVRLNEKLNEYNLSFQDTDKFLALLINAKDNGFDPKKIVARLKKIQSLENKEERLKHNCEILSEQVKECNNVLPLAQKIRAMNIDIKQLLVFESTVNQLAKEYNLPPYIAALRLFNDITYYNKIGGLKKELSRLCQQIFVFNGICANQNRALAAMLNLQNHGITEDRLLQ